MEKRNIYVSLLLIAMTAIVLGVVQFSTQIKLESCGVQIKGVQTYVENLRKALLVASHTNWYVSRLVGGALEVTSETNGVGDRILIDIPSGRYFPVPEMDDTKAPVNIHDSGQPIIPNQQVFFQIDLARTNEIIHARIGY